MRSRPATILRPAPAASTASPYDPAGTSHRRGSTFTRRHQRFTHVRPSPQDGRPPPQGREASPLPAGLLLARRPRMEREPLRLLPRASHPAVTHDARRGGDRPSRTGPGTTPSTSAEPPMVPPTSLMHPHVAPSRRWPPAPPPAPRRPPGPSPAADDSGSLEIRTVSQPLPGLGHPHQHRPAPMQIDPDELPDPRTSAHRGLLESMDVSTPSMRRGRHEERRPRSFIASISGGRPP